MGGKGNDLVIECCDNKLNILLRNTFNTLLNDMISILVTYTAHHMTIELFNHFNLLIKINNFNGLCGWTKHKTVKTFITNTTIVIQYALTL